MNPDKTNDLARVRRNLPNLAEVLDEAVEFVTEAEMVVYEDARSEMVEMATNRIDSMIYLLNQARRIINH